ncbi:MAG: baseplate multidomain protein megatron [Alkalilacustris sp.]
MATIILGAVGGAIGSGLGGSVLGLSAAAIGQAAGATIGNVIDQRVLGGGSQAVETGRVDRLRLTGASEGAPVPRVWGRTRVGGQVIWASRFIENASTSRVGGRKTGTRVTQYSYSVNIAIALCEGEIVGVGRIWADGAELASDRLALRVYTGREDQLPDPRIEAIEGPGQAPAYRGIAYVVIEDLDLAPFGGRVPQFTFEVLRSASGAEVPDLMGGVQAVALIPGTGEASLSTRPAEAGRSGRTLPDLPDAVMPALEAAVDGKRPINVNTPTGRTDMEVALGQLTTELPNCRSVLLVVSWFGNDLRCGSCAVRPKVELASDGPAWHVCGLDRGDAETLATIAGRVVYGGTPSDHTVREGIAALHAAGQKVVFYPFLLMEQMEGNILPDPWSGALAQPALPWRGRITTSVAPGRPGSPDRSAVAEAEVAAFFGTVQPDDFAIRGDRIVYSGPSDDWGFRRFILHYAWLARSAGGVDAFCVGSEMRSLTQIRGAGDRFPAVQAFRKLAADVRTILGPDVKISYAADWSEYFGYQSPEGTHYFHLDPFWADDAVDFIGIDNYLPLSDWRDGDDHLDAAAGWKSVHELEYLQENVAGGEYYDWYYRDAAARHAQVRTPIEDGEQGRPWRFRPKDLIGWWSNPHEGPDGPTPWVPQSKPIWFTELGCPAVDRGTNQPNVFFDPKSSESLLPHYSDGRRDDTIQQQYHRAMIAHWRKSENNPISPVYGGPMVDMSRAHVWAWDARPFPAFPALTEVWSDGPNWRLGHWITGRTASQPLASVVAEICRSAGVTAIDVRGVHGLVRGLRVASTDSARSVLQILMLAYGLEVAERDGQLVFFMRGSPAREVLVPDLVGARDGGAIELVREADADVAGRIRVIHVEAEGDFDIRAVEAALADDPGALAVQSDLPVVLLPSEAQGIAERWLAEARVARDTLRLTLPPSSRLGAGDVFALDLPEGRREWRIDRVDLMGAQEVTAVRVESGLHLASDQPGPLPRLRPFATVTPLLPIFMELPLLTGTEDPRAPHLAVTAATWSGSAAVFAAPPDQPFTLVREIEGRAALGITQNPLAWAASGRWDRGAPLLVRMLGASLRSASPTAVLAGANAMAIGSGASGPWEVFQFATAELVGPNLWAVSMRLRGQAGTEVDMPEAWPEGSMVVLLDAAVAQVPLPPALRGVPLKYRVGPAALAYDERGYVELEVAFEPIGLRPYAPAHLRIFRREDGALSFSWIRRTRLGGDDWSGEDVPLAEGTERYRVQVRKDGAVLRQVDVPMPGWTYDIAAQAQDGVTRPLSIAVAQLSLDFGPGPFTEIVIP